jgi:hypothetical protein
VASDAARRRDIAVIARAARAAEDQADMTAAARQVANWGRYYNATDPALPHEERCRQAVARRDAHMARMRLARGGAK